MAVGIFFFAAALTAQNSPELHFRFIDSFIQSSLLESLLAVQLLLHDLIPSGISDPQDCWIGGDFVPMCIASRSTKTICYCFLCAPWGAIFYPDDDFDDPKSRLWQLFHVMFLMFKNCSTNVTKFLSKISLENHSNEQLTLSIKIRYRLLTFKEKKILSSRECFLTSDE